MAVVSRFLGIELMFCDDINAGAHVHVAYNQYRCVVSMDGYAILSGQVPPRVAALVVEWAMINHKLISSNWELHKAGNTNIPMIPALFE